MANVRRGIPKGATTEKVSTKVISDTVVNDTTKKSAVAKAAADPLAGKVIELRVINPKRLGTIMIRGIKNTSTGNYESLVDSNGEETSFAINKAVIRLRLDDPFERRVYEIAKIHPHYFLTPYPKYVLYDVLQDAQDKLKDKELEVDAILLIKSLNSIQLANFARLFGIRTDTVQEVVVKKRMYEIAQDTPQELLDKWNDPRKDTMELMQSALQKGVFKVEAGIWYYGQQPMGDSFDRALLWLNENQDLIPIIKESTDKIAQ